MSKNFAQRLTNSEWKEAREFEAMGLTTISQAVKAFERNDTNQLNTWRRMVDEVEQGRSQTLFDDLDNAPTSDDFDEAINRAVS